MKKKTSGNETESELDALCNLHVLTAEERVKILLRKLKVLKDDVGTVIIFL